MNTAKPYNDFGDFLRAVFPFKVQKISVHAGLTCPNRDRTKGVGGCTYCNNQTFSPEYCSSNQTITQQLDKGVRFFSHKYPNMKYLAYFQSYTNTYGEPDKILQMFNEAIHYPGVVGLVISTRPDCVPEHLLNDLEKLSKHSFLLIEYGIESTCNPTLQRINRQHTYEDAVDAVKRTSARNIFCGAHLILGLPGEDRSAILSHADNISQLPLNTVKLHQLQLIRHTVMAKQFEENPTLFRLYSLNDYIDLCIDFVERLHPDFFLDRFVSQSPAQWLIAPKWDVKNYVFTARFLQRMRERGTQQGKYYNS